MHPIRIKNLDELTKRGFVVAESLPWGQLNEETHWRLRPNYEIAGRLLALDALVTWVAAPESAVPSEALNGYIKNSGLEPYLTPSDREILALSRSVAHSEHVDRIGWRLENMWSLAWVLGFDPQPQVGGMIPDKVTAAITREFIPRPGATVDGLLAKAQVRPLTDVVGLEDFFYCAHNAVRSAQLGGSTVPPGFDPIADGGTVHERRLSLNWCISPDYAWDDTDMSS